MEHANRARIREGAECTSLLDTGSDDGLAQECDSHPVAADESAITSSTLAHTRREAGEIMGTATGDGRRRIFGHRRWSTTLTSKFLLAFVLSLLPSVTLQVEYYPTQISVISAPFLATGTVLGGVPFGPTIVELKDADYQTTKINDGNFVTVSLDSGGISELTAGKTVLRFGVDALDGVGNFSSLKIDKVCKACRLRFVYKSLQVFSDFFDVIPSPPHKIVMIKFPLYGISAINLDPNPSFRVVDKGGNDISTVYEGFIFKAAPESGQLRQRQNIFTVRSSGGMPNMATFSRIFFSIPTTSTSLVVGFVAKFPGNLTVSAEVPGLVITGKIKYGRFQAGFLPLPNQTASIPLTTQPIVTLRDWTDEQVKAKDGQIQVTATLLGGESTGATLQGTTIIKSVDGIAIYTNLAVDMAGHNYTIKFAFLSCDTNLNCDSLDFVCESLSDFCASAYTSASLQTTPFSINIGIASTLKIAIQPSNAIAGVSISPAPVIQILDLGGNQVRTAATVAVALQANDKGASLLSSPEQMLISSVNGIATFTALSIDKTGAGFRLFFYSIAPSGERLQSFSNPMSITAAPIKRITVTVQPGSALRGSYLSIQPRVAVLDRFNNLATEDVFVKAVTAELIGFGQVGTLGGQVVQSFENGIAVFTDLSVNNPAAKYVIRFSANGTYDESYPKVGEGRVAINPPLLAESQPFAIIGLVSALQVQQQPGLAYGGSAFLTQPRVALVDLNQQIVASATRTVRATVIPRTSDAAVLRPIPALQAAKFGIVQFTDLSLDLAGPGFRLKFEVLGVPEPIAILSDAFAVMIGNPSALLILAQPTDQVAAVPIVPAPSVKVVDLGGNTVPYNDYFFVEAVHGPFVDKFEIIANEGIASFTKAINAAGTDYRLRFLLPYDNMTIQVTSNSFVITRGVLFALDIIAQPGHGIVDQPLTTTPIVIVKDAGGNTLVDYEFPIVVSRAEGPSASYVVGNMTVAPRNGEAYFNGLSVTGTARSYKLLFQTTEITLSGPRTLTVVSKAFTVTFGPTSLQVQNPPGPRDNAQIGGKKFTFQPIVAFMDSEGQVVKARSSTISLSLPAPDGLSGTLTLSSFEGMSVFTDLSIKRASFPSFHSISVSAGAFTTNLRVQVKPGTASALSVFIPPSDAKSGKLLPEQQVGRGQVVLQFLDLGGNIVTGPSAQEPVTVQLAANKFGGQLEGTLTTTPALGVATFTNLQVNGIGNGYTLLFTCTSFRVESTPFSVHGKPVALGIISFPAGTIVKIGPPPAGIPEPRMPPIRVALLDEANNVITGRAAGDPVVTIGVSLNNFGLAWDVLNDRTPLADVSFDSTLGITSATVVNGSAVFDNLVLTCNAAATAMQGLRLKFISNVGGLEIISPFFSTSLDAWSLKFKRQIGSAQSSGLSLMPMPIVRIHASSGAGGGIVRGSLLNLTVSLINGRGAVLEGTKTVDSSAGVYIFTDLSISKATDPGQFYTLQFQVPPNLRNPLSYPELTLLSDQFTVSVGPPAGISLKSDLVPSTSGLPFASQPCIALRDAGLNLVRMISTVTASLVSSGQDSAMLIGVQILNSTDGLVSFTDLGITRMVHGAAYQISFKNGQLETRSAVFPGQSGPPFTIEMLSHPGKSFGGWPLQPSPEMRVTDAGGTLVAGPVEIMAIFETNPNGNSVLLENTALIRNGIAKFTQISVSKAFAGYVLLFQCATASTKSQSFDVIVGPAKRLFVDAQPGTSVFGVNIVPAPRVVVMDAGDNWVSTSTEEIHARLILPDHMVGPTLMSATKLQGILSRKALAGVAVFDDLTIDNAGSGFRIEFSSIGLDIFTTQSFDVTGPPGVLAVLLDPTWVASGTRVSVDNPLRYQPIVKVKDYDGSLVSYYDVVQGVTASVPAGQRLSGNPFADIIRGSAVFTDLQLHTAADTVKISFAYGGPMLTTSVISPAIDVEPGAPRYLNILVQPSSASRGQKLGLQPRLQVLDAAENPVTWYTGSVSVKLRLGDENMAEYMRGTTTVLYASGISFFTDLNVLLENQNFVMRFQTGGLQVDSQPFNIKQGPPGAMVIANPPIGGVSTVGGGILQPQPIINVVDLGYGVVKSFSGVGRCAGKDCAVSVILPCCPVNHLGEYAGAGKLIGQTKILAVDGQAFFTDLRIDALGDYTLRFSVEAIDGVSGEIFYDLENIPVQDFASMKIVNQPGQALLGMPMRGQPLIQIMSSSNQKVNASYHEVNVTLTPDVGCVGLTGTTRMVAMQGSVQFTDLSLSSFAGAPTCQLNFSTNNPPTFVLSQLFSMIYGPSRLLLPTEPAGAQAGVVFTTQPRLEFRDKGNFLLASESGQTVSAELLQGDFDTLCGDVTCQSLLLGRTSILNTNGESIFTNLRVDKIHPAGYILLFRTGKYTIYSNRFLVAPGSAVSLRIIQQPSTCQMTQRLQVSPSVELLDAGRNRVNSSGIVTARIFPTSFTGLVLSGDQATALEGVAIFPNITLNGDTVLGVSLEFLSGGLSVVSEPFLAHRPAKAFVLRNPMPLTLTAGETFLPEQTVELRDDFDFATVADSSSSVKVSLVNGNTGAVTAMPDMEVASRGISTFRNLTVFQKGTYVFRYFLTSTPSVSADSNYFSVVASNPKYILAGQQPQLSLAAAIMMPYPSVYTEDAFRNRISSSPGYYVNACVAKGEQCSDTASLQGISTLPLDAEIVIFSNLTLHGPPLSGYRLSFYINLPGNIKIFVVSDAFDVRMGLPMLKVERQPDFAKESEVFLRQPLVSISDGAGNRFSGAFGGISYLQVTASLSISSVDDARLFDSLGACPCVSRLVDGVATFSGLQINRAGHAFQVEFSIFDINIANVRTKTFHVSGSVLYAEVIGMPTTIAYETQLDVSCRLRDANSLSVASQSLTVGVVDEKGSFRYNSLYGTTAVSALGGEGVFIGLKFKEIGGPYRLKFNASGFVDYSGPFTVIARNGTNIAFFGLPKRVLAMSTISPAPLLQVRDEFGAVSGFGGSLVVTVVDVMNVSLQAPLVVEVLEGIGSLSALAITRSSTEQHFRLRVEASLLGQVYTVYSQIFLVDAGRLAALMCIVQPSDGITDQVLPRQPTVHAVDLGGNLLTYFSRQVTVVLSDTDTTTVLRGTNIMLAQNGVAIFTDLVVTKPRDDHTLLVSTAESGGLVTMSHTFKVTMPLSYISLTVAPPGPSGGTLWMPQPEVTFFDARGVSVSAIVRSVTVSLCAKPQGSLAKLSGNTSLRAVNGIVRFTDISLDLQGTYTVCYTSGQYVVNRTMTNQRGSARYIRIVKQPGVLTAGQSWNHELTKPHNPIFVVTDAGGNPFLTDSGQGVQVDKKIQIEVLNSGTRIKEPMIMCGTCKQRATPCYDPTPYVFDDPMYVSPSTPECLLKTAGRRMIIKLSVLENNMIIDSVLSDPFDVVTGRCNRLRVILNPGGVIVSEPFRRNPIVEMRDAADNIVTWVRDVIKVTLVQPAAKTGTATLSGCIADNGDTPNTNVDGTATFFGCIIQCKTGGSYNCLGDDFSLRFSMESGCDGEMGIASVDTTLFTVSPPANQIRVNTASMPTTMAAGLMPTQPRIDYYVSPCSTTGTSCLVESTSTGLTVTAQIYAAPNGATLKGATTALVVNGVAQFTDLSINEASVDLTPSTYNITFYAVGFPPINNFLTVNFGTVSSLKIIQQPTFTVLGSPFRSKVALTDAGGNVVRSAGEALWVTIALDSSFGVRDGVALKGTLRVLSCTSSCSSGVSSGEAEWADLTVNKAPVIYSFTFSATKPDGTYLEVKSSRISVSIGGVAEIQLLSQPKDTLAGDELSTIVAQLFDAGGNKIRPNSPLIVGIVLKSGGGSLTGTVNATATPDGVVTFDDLSVTYSTGESRHVLKISFGSNFVTSNPFFVHLVPFKIAMRTFPSQLCFAGEALPEQPALEFRDARENIAYLASGANVVSVSFNNSQSLGGNLTAVAKKGVAYFTDLRIMAVGSFKLTFTSAAFTAVESVTIEVLAGIVAALAVVPSYQPGMNGTNLAGYSLPLQPRVQVLDSSGGIPIPVPNQGVTATIVEFPAGTNITNIKILFGNTNAVPDPVSGIAKFTNLAINTVGNFRLQFSLGTMAVVSRSFTIVHGPIAQIIFRDQPSPAFFGEVLFRQPVIQLLDRGSNPVRGSPWIHITLGKGRISGSALTECDSAYAVQDTGVVTMEGCKVVGTNSGEHTLLVGTLRSGKNVLDVDFVFDTEMDSRLVHESAPFIVSLPSHQIVLKTAASAAISQNAFQVQPTLHAIDVQGTLITLRDTLISVSLGLTANSSALLGNKQALLANGIARFTDLQIDVSGAFSLNFQLTTAGNTYSINQSILVAPSSPSKLISESWPVMLTSGDTLASGSGMPRILVRDSADNFILHAVNVSVTANCTDKGGSPCFQGTKTVAASSGVSSFKDLVLHSAGIVSLSFSHAALGISIRVQVNAGKAVRIKILQQPPSSFLIRATIAPALRIRLEDAYGNIAADLNYTNAVVAIYSSPISGATLSGIVTSTFVDGIGDFNNSVSVNSPGSGFRLVFRSGILETISDAFTVNTLPTQMKLIVFPDQGIGGQVLDPQPQISLRDDIDLVRNPSFTVIAKVEARTANFTGSSTVMTSEGIAKFTDLKIDKMGKHTLRFECITGTKTFSIVSSVLLLVPGEPYSISVERQPGGFASGGAAFPIQPQIFLRDAGGNIAGTSRSVTVNIEAPSTAKIGGSNVKTSGSEFGIPVVTYSAGALVFTDLSIDVAGTHVLTFTSPGLISAQTAAFVVTVGPAAQLAIIAQPGDVSAGLPFGKQPILQIRDLGGNHVQEGVYTVTAQVNMHSVRGAVLSTLELRAAVLRSVRGWLNYTALQIDVAALFCDIKFDAPGLRSAISENFIIAAVSPASTCNSDITFLSDCGSPLTKTQVLRVEVQPTNVINGKDFSPAPEVRIRDLDGMVLTASGHVFASVISSTGARLYNGKQALVGGIATFRNMSIVEVGLNFRIQFRFGDLVAMSASFNVTTGSATNIRLSSKALTESVVNSIIPSFQVDLRDHGNFLVKDDDAACPKVSVAIKSGPTTLSLRGNTVASVSVGQAIFAGLQISVTGIYNLQFRCDSSGLGFMPFGTETGNITFYSYGAPSSIQIETQPGQAVANFKDALTGSFKYYFLNVNPKIRVVDKFGNLVHGFQGHFQAAKAPGGFTLAKLSSTEGDAIILPARWGMVEFDNLVFMMESLAMKNESAQIGFKSTCCSIMTASSEVVSRPIVFNAAPDQMALTVPAIIRAGEPFSLNVTIKTAPPDVNLYTYLGSMDIVLRNSTTQAVSNSMSGVRRMRGVSGVVSFPELIISQPGTYYIHAYATRPNLYLPQISQDILSAPFTVVVGPGRKLSFLNNTQGCKGGVVCSTQPRLQILDAAGNAVAQSLIVVQVATVVTSSAGGGCCTEKEQDCPVQNMPCPILGGSLEAKSDATGKVLFSDVSLSTAGTVQLNFTALGSSIVETVKVNVGQKARAKIVIPPTGLVAGAAFTRQPIVIASDYGGNWVSVAEDNITAKVTLLGCTPGDLGCDNFGTMLAKNTGGISRFTDLGTQYAGLIRLEFRLLSVPSCGIVSCWSTTPTMLVSPGIPSQLAIVSNTVKYFCSGKMDPSWDLDIRDKSGNRVVSGGPYTLTVTSTPLGEVGGTTSVQSIAGQASFRNMTIMKSCYFHAFDAFEFCYTLTFKLGDIFVTSNPFTVMAGSTSDLEFDTQPAATSAGSPPGYPSVRLVDISGNPVIPVPPGISKSCGIASIKSGPAIATPDNQKFDGVNLKIDAVSPTIAYEKTNALTLLLGLGESYVRKTSVVFNGLNMNWRVPQCYFPTSCPISFDNFQNFRVRAVARFGSLVADSDLVSVDAAHPVDFNIYETNFSAIVLRWNSPFFGPSPVSYRLRYRSLNTPGAEWSTLRNLKTNMYAFADLGWYEMMEFQLCSQSLFGDRCALRGPPSIMAAPVQAVTAVEVAYANEDSVFLSWNAPPHGLPPPAYQITVQEVAGGTNVIPPTAASRWETVLLSDVVGLNVTIPALSPNKTYIFGVYSKAAGGNYYSPLGAKTEPVMPVAAAGASISCPMDSAGQKECTGTGLVVSWQPPSFAKYQPRNYKVKAEQYFTNMTVAFKFEEFANRSTSMSVTIRGLTLGRLTRLRLFAESVNNATIYAPAVNFYVIPTAAPSRPTELSLKMRSNKNIFASWQLPLDSGDGTQDGTEIHSYIIQHRTEDAMRRVPVERLAPGTEGEIIFEEDWEVYDPNDGKYNLTREFSGLRMGSISLPLCTTTTSVGVSCKCATTTSESVTCNSPSSTDTGTTGVRHAFRISAKNRFRFGQVCTTECSDLAPLLLEGKAIESEFILGQIPYWDAMHAPVKQDPPPLFNLFVGNLFTFSLKALSTGLENKITISATGLEDCGASLTSMVVGNPATATLTLLPAIQHLDKLFWICFVATDDRGAYSDERCLQAYVVRPNPTFLAPIDPTRTDPVVRASYTTAAGCLLEFDVKAHDLTSGKGISAATASSLGYKCFLREHRSVIFSKYETKTIEGLPENAVLQAGVVKYANPSTRVFSWRPKRGQEAYDYHVCFTVEDSLGTSNTASPEFAGAFCAHIRIKRCRMCLLPGESLISVAQNYGTEWLNIWSGNNDLLRPAEALESAEIILGPLYKVLPHESIYSIAARMSLDTSELLSWNPDLQSAFNRNTNRDVLLDISQEICVLPSTCTQ